MPEIISRSYNCDVCGTENDVTYNKGYVVIQNVNYETRQCHSCNAKYRYINKLLFLIPSRNGTSAITENIEGTDKKKDNKFTDALVLLLFGFIGLVVLAGVFLLIHSVTPSVSSFSETAKNAVTKSIEDAPYIRYDKGKLYIDDFEYSFGVIEINKASGDFDKLNRKVFSLLKNHTGNCAVYVNIKSQDKYGNITEVYQRKGTINTNELRKYKNVELWAKSGGMQRILLR